MNALSILASLTSKHLPINQARRKATPYTVQQPSLVRHEVDSEAFEAAMEERHQWIAENVTSDHMIEPLCGGGRLYRFEDPNEALHFKMRF